MWTSCVGSEPSLILQHAVKRESLLKLNKCSLWEMSAVMASALGVKFCLSILFSSFDGHIMQYKRGRRRKLMRTMLPEKASVFPVICSPVLERKACRQLLLKPKKMRETDCEQV